MVCESILEYKDSPLFKPDETGIYGMLSYVKIQYSEYPVVGICCLEDADETAIIMRH